MSVIRNGTQYAVKVSYDPSYDASGELGLKAYSQTFTRVKETATYAQLKAFVDALMSLTAYASASYRVSLVETSTLEVN